MFPQAWRRPLRPLSSMPLTPWAVQRLGEVPGPAGMCSAGGCKPRGVLSRRSRGLPDQVCKPAAAVGGLAR